MLNNRGWVENWQKTYLCRTLCMFKRRETVVKGAEDGDHRLRHALALADALPHELRSHETQPACEAYELLSMLFST